MSRRSASNFFLSSFTWSVGTATAAPAPMTPAPTPAMSLAAACVAVAGADEAAELVAAPTLSDTLDAAEPIRPATSDAPPSAALPTRVQSVSLTPATAPLMTWFQR